MKMDSDNFRSSAIQDIISKLQAKGVNIIIYEPTLKTKTFNNCKIVNDILEFDQVSDIVIVNRFDEKVKTLSTKIYSRDLFSRD